MFESVRAKKNPIGVEFIKKGILTQGQVNKVLEYKKNHPELKFGEIVDILDMCDKNEILEVLSSSLNVESVMIDRELSITPTDYLPRDIIINYRAIPFKINNNKLSVAFADPTDEQNIKEIQLMLMNNGYEMEKYLTLYTSIMNKLGEVRKVENAFVNKEEKDITKLIDNILMTAVSSRASDIHFEPMEDKVRIRYRIDGELLLITELPKERQELIIGRLKAISNMHQEITQDQDGSINTIDGYSIRVSSQNNVNGEKFVLRLLKKNTNVKTLEDLGFPGDKNAINKAFKKNNSLILVCAPTGEGKTTTLYSVLEYLNNPNINVVSIENPVEMRLKGINQIETGPNITFASALRTVLRQDPDIILVGEIRDRETATISIESGQTGHLVLSTIHTIDAVESINRLRKIGISSYDISSTLATTVAQRLVRRLCPKCKEKVELSKEDIEYIEKVEKKYGIKFDKEKANTYKPVGCEYCNSTGYYERIALIEIFDFSEEVRDLVSREKSTLEIKKHAIANESYKPLIIDGVEKVLAGVTTVDELKRKVNENI